MKKKITFTIVEDGECAIIYSVKLVGEEIDEYEKFTNEFAASHPQQFRNITTTFDNISNRLGVRENFFKPESYDKSVDRLKLVKEKKDHLYPLRIYCLRYGSRSFIIIGGGTKKEKPNERYQDNPNSYRAIKILEQINDYIVENSINPEVDIDLLLELEIEVDI